MPETLALPLSVVTVRLMRRWWHRRRRGRWGLLQDRFLAVALTRGAAPTAANAVLAEAFADDAAAASAAVLAAELDASAFAHHWADDDTVYARALDILRDLEHSR